MVQVSRLQGIPVTRAQKRGIMPGQSLGMHAILPAQYLCFWFLAPSTYNSSYPDSTWSNQKGVAYESSLFALPFQCSL